MWENILPCAIIEYIGCSSHELLWETAKTVSRSRLSAPLITHHNQLDFVTSRTVKLP